MGHINTWADINKYYSETTNDTIMIVCVTYLAFIEDIFVEISQYDVSQGFYKVLIEARLRTAYQDLTTDLHWKIESLYSYLATQYSPNDYSFM